VDKDTSNIKITKDSRVIKLNFKAVVVIIFGLFCLYSYIRLISPYLDVGSSEEPVSATVFSRTVVNINGERYSYWSNNVVKPKRIVVMLPPSAATGDYFGKYTNVFPSDVLIVAPDYPGRGMTDSIKVFDTVPLLSNRVATLLEYVLGKNSFDIVAPSFGGMIGTELSKNSSLKINKLFLIATGEFFAPDQKFMYRLLFYPATLSEDLRAKYVSLLTSWNVFANLQNTNIKDMLEQWLATLDYKIDISSRITVPTTIIVFDKDNVVQSESRSKLKEVFINSSIIHMNLTHTSPSFFSSELERLLSTNI
jgi:pimeloyl-ACP methyl ester carboxylesterase